MSWVDLADDMDVAVDDQFAEPIELHPWLPPGYEEGSGADTTRPVIKTEGIVVTPGARVIGEISSDPSAAKTVESDIWISLRNSALITDKPEDWRQGDRVYLVNRDQWYEINYPSGQVATYRPNIHLVRVPT